MPTGQMAATLESLVARQAEATTAEGYRHLLQEAGFARVAEYFSVLGGVMGGWLGR